jgi:hypothetical protein
MYIFCVGYNIENIKYGNTSLQVLFIYYYLL